MIEVPAGWLAVKLGDVVDYASNMTVHPNEMQSDAWLVELEDIERDSSVLLSHATVKDRKPQSAKNSFQAGDVLYGKLRPYLNKVIRADRSGYCSSEIIPIRPDQIDGGYLFHYLKSPHFLSYVRSVTHGVRMPRLGTQQAKSAPFLLPPVEEQKRIAQKLDALLAQVDTLKARIDAIPVLIRRFRQAVLDGSASGELTRSWRTALDSDEQEVRHQTIHVEHGTWPSTSIPSGWRWLPFNQCYSDETDSRKKVPQSAYEQEGSLAVVDQGESLIGGYTSNLGLKSSVTLPAIVFGDHTRCIKFVHFEFAQGADGIKVLAPEREILEPLYAYLSFQACRLPNKGYSRHMKFVRATMFPVPPMDEQAEIVRRVEQLFTFADQLEAKVATARKRIDALTQSLLAKAFRGELVPQDPDDEPASVLLERIRAQRAAAPKPKRGRKAAAR